MVSEGRFVQCGSNCRDRNVLKRFPFLNVLDGAPIQLTEEDQQAILRTRKVLPLDSRPSFFDNEQNQNIAWEFLQK